MPAASDDAARLWRPAYSALLAHSLMPTACPQPAEADIRPLDGNSRFDPKCERHTILCASSSLGSRPFGVS